MKSRSDLMQEARQRLMKLGVSQADIDCAVEGIVSETMFDPDAPEPIPDKAWLLLDALRALREAQKALAARDQDAVNRHTDDARSCLYTFDKIDISQRNRDHAQRERKRKKGLPLKADLQAEFWELVANNDGDKKRAFSRLCQRYPDFTNEGVRQKLGVPIRK